MPDCGQSVILPLGPLPCPRITVTPRLRSIFHATKATVEVVWEPTWTPDMMSEAAWLQLGMV